MLSALLFACTFAVLFGLALWRYPVCGLYLYIGVFYIHPPSRWWGPYLPNLRWSLLAAAVAALALIVHSHRASEGRRPWATTVPGLVLLLFVLWMSAQSLWAIDTELHYEAWLQLVKYVVAFYLIYRLADTPQKITDVLMVHVAGCLYLGWLCFQRGRTGDGRLDGVGGPGIDDANTLGMVLATGVVVALVLVLAQTGWRRIACALSIPFILNGVILAGSRGAFLGLLAGVVVLSFLRPPQRRWLFLGFALLGVVLAASLVDTRFIDRMFTIKSAVEEGGEIDGSAESRVVLFEAQLKMFSSHPFGVGHRGTAVLSPQYLDERYRSRSDGSAESARRSSHNTFMTALVEQGIPGAILFVWMTLWGVSRVLQVKGMQGQRAPPEAIAPAAACCAGMAVVWTSGQFTDYLMAEVQIWMLALLSAALDQLRRRQSANVALGTTRSDALVPR